MPRSSFLHATLFLAAGLIVFYLGQSWKVYQRNIGQPGTGSVGRGATPDALSRAGRAQMREGIDALRDPDLSGPERTRLFVEHLERAEELLTRSLHQNPVQPEALSSLAAVRYELSPPASETETDSILALIEAASSVAPSVPLVRVQLGRLLLMMGRREEALAQFDRALELEPSSATRVATALAEQGWSAADIGEALPHTSLLLSLQPAYEREGRLTDYLELLESILASRQVDVLRRYGYASLAAGEPHRLIRSLRMLGELDTREAEAERLLHLGRASLATTDVAQAVLDTREAVQLAPGDVRALEVHGNALAADGQGSAAIVYYQRALQQIAIGGDDPGARARLYRRIGQAEEENGKPDRAYDAYRRALSLNPAETVARDRLTALGG